VKKLEICKLSFVTIKGLVYEAKIIYKTILERHPSKSGENIQSFAHKTVIWSQSNQKKL
jgi:hypothetical protein